MVLQSLLGLLSLWDVYSEFRISSSTLYPSQKDVCNSAERAWIYVGRTQCCLQSHQVSVMTPLVYLTRGNPLLRPGAGSLLNLLWTEAGSSSLGWDLAAWLCTFLNVKPMSDLQPLGMGCLNPHAGSQSPTLGGYGNFWLLVHHTEVEGDKGSNLCPFSAQLHHRTMLILSQARPHTTVRRPLLSGRHSQEF